MRIVLDTSVIVSGLLSPHASPAQIVAAWREGRFVLLYSQEIYDEYADVLSGRGYTNDCVACRTVCLIFWKRSASSEMKSSDSYLFKAKYAIRLMKCSCAAPNWDKPTIL
ncbi:MAG: PIN domain-containing protein [Chloroflexi bacterium]|nr:PIN domain-containing protein [Chloroflexota bacterium]